MKLNDQKALIEILMEASQTLEQHPEVGRGPLADELYGFALELRDDLAAQHAAEAQIAQWGDPKRGFSVYGGEGFSSVRLGQLSQDPDVVARVEQSGSEGFYVEAIRWDEGASRWERYAFEKVFDLTEAEVLANRINQNSGTSPVFHRMNTAQTVSAAAAQIEAGISAEERPPTGDDYNALMAVLARHGLGPERQAVMPDEACDGNAERVGQGPGVS